MKKSEHKEMKGEKAITLHQRKWEEKLKGKKREYIQGKEERERRKTM